MLASLNKHESFELNITPLLNVTVEEPELLITTLATFLSVVVFVETVFLVGLVLAVLVRQNMDQDKYQLQGFNKVGAGASGSTRVLIALFIGFIGGIVHYSIGLILSTQSLGFNTYLLHQFLSFFIFAVISLIVGLGGGISSH